MLTVKMVSGKALVIVKHKGRKFATGWLLPQTARKLRLTLSL